MGTDMTTDGTPERVDNTNAINRALLAALIAASGVDAATVVEAMAADGKLSAMDMDAAVEKGWIARERIDEAANTAIRDAQTAAQTHPDNL